MKANDLSEKKAPVELPSLNLPAAFDARSFEKAIELDELLKDSDGHTGDEMTGRLKTKVGAYRDAAFSHLVSLRDRVTFDISLFRWPQSLYIPKNANASDYWISPAPDDHRYNLDWTAPASATANTASCLDGKMFTYAIFNQTKAGSSQSSESGVGIFFKPSMSLGVIDLQPRVDCSGTLRTMLNFFPQLAAGYVEVKAQLLLAAWQQIPNGYDLLAYKQFEVASSGRRDQSHGAEMLPFQKTFDGPELSAPFVVQAGRTYLLGVVSRMVVISTLTSSSGGSLPAISSSELRVWGSMNSIVTQINVNINRVDIP